MIFFRLENQCEKTLLLYTVQFLCYSIVVIYVILIWFSLLVNFAYGWLEYLSQDIHQLSAIVVNLLMLFVS